MFAHVSHLSGLCEIFKQQCLLDLRASHAWLSTLLLHLRRARYVTAICRVHFNSTRVERRSNPALAAQWPKCGSICRWCTHPGRRVDAESAKAHWIALAHLLGQMLQAHFSSLPVASLPEAHASVQQLLRHAVHGQRNGTRWDDLILLDQIRPWLTSASPCQQSCEQKIYIGSYSLGD